jgi:hypothetical protein
MDLQKEEAPVRPASVPRFDGGNPKCARCGKSVFANEKVVAASKDWHEACTDTCNGRFQHVLVRRCDASGLLFSDLMRSVRPQPQGSWYWWRWYSC